MTPVTIPADAPPPVVEFVPLSEAEKQRAKVAQLALVLNRNKPQKRG